MTKPKVPSRARRTMAIRLSAAERDIIEKAAAARPEYPTKFVREAALDAARQELAKAPSEQ